MKPFIIFIAIIVTVSLTSAVWIVNQAIQREKIRELNLIIQEQHETLYVMAMKHAQNWKEKNMAWNELNRARR